MAANKTYDLRKKDKKLPLIALAVLAVCLLLCVVLVMCTGGSNPAGAADSTQTAGPHIYDNAEVYGTIAITHMNEADFTEEALEDYYFNFYLTKFFLKKHIIVFDDTVDVETEHVKGIDFIGANIYYGVTLESNGDGTYTNISAGEDDITTYYEKDGHLAK